MINLTDKYKTRSGLPVTVYANEIRSEFPVLATVHYPNHDSVYQFTSEGNFHNGVTHEHELDLIKFSPYDHIKIDDKVNVWDKWDSKVYRGHFAGLSKDGLPMAWSEGKTSWTSGSEDYDVWDYCELTKPKTTPE